jgi:hypothetical protein
MTIAMISAISFVLGATVAYLAHRYPAHREAIEMVGALSIGGFGLLGYALKGFSGHDQPPRAMRRRRRYEMTESIFPNFQM